MSSIPVLPAIKKHRLNLERASQRVNENYNSCRDSGTTSDAYKVTDNFADKVGSLVKEDIRKISFLHIFCLFFKGTKKN